MQTFTIPGPFGPDVPFDELHIWQWAKTQARADVEIGKYLDSIGFVVGKDRLSESDYDNLQHAIEHFHRVEPHYPGVLSFAEALQESVDGSGFYVVGKPVRYSLAPMLREALAGSGWIYDIEPASTYLEIVRGTLWAKYQRIIGSRPLVRIEGA